MTVSWVQGLRLWEVFAVLSMAPQSGLQHLPEQAAATSSAYGIYDRTRLVMLGPSRVVWAWFEL